MPYIARPFVLRRSGRRAVINEAVKIIDSASVLAGVMIDHALAVEILGVVVPGSLTKDDGHDVFLAAMLRGSVSKGLSADFDTP